VPTWGAILAPLGTPPEIIDRLSREIARVMQQPDIRAKFIDLGSEPLGSTPEALGAVIRRDAALWQKVIKDAGITAD
jgi:tripartite-type tricarboxylate transporter receptor subunit TctC